MDLHVRIVCKRQINDPRLRNRMHRARQTSYLRRGSDSMVPKFHPTCVARQVDSEGL